MRHLHSQIRRFADSQINLPIFQSANLRILGFTLVCLVSVATGILCGQARSAPDWTTAGFDAQRSSWMRVDPYISIESLPKFQFLWKLEVDNESRFGNSLTAPVALGNLMTFRGFKSLIFVGGSSNNVYAIDYDFGTIFWRTHHNYAAGAREFAGSPRCPGGMTVPLTRATALTPPTSLAFFGFARPPRPAKGDVGEPGKGAPQLAEIAARIAARGNRGGGGGDTAAPAGRANTPDASAAVPASSAATADRPGRGPAPPARGVAPQPNREGGRGGRAPNFVFSVAADGLLRGLIPDTGDLALAPAKFLPANATATGLIWADGLVYAATSNNCGGAPEAVWAMDYASEQKPVTVWETDGATIAGIALDTEGTVYVATGSGTSQYANAIVALDGRTLTVKDWVKQESPFTSAPTVFSEGEKSYVAATSGNRLYVLDAASLGGADHRTPLSTTSEAGTRFSSDGVATWRDGAGTRWILAEANGAIAGYKVSEKGGTLSLDRMWTSRTMPSPRTPIVVNGVVFALAAGLPAAAPAGAEAGGLPAAAPAGAEARANDTAHAVLYALDPATGKELWNSGTTITAAASAGLSAGTGQVYVVTADNTVWSFGIPLAIN
jgi:outer membrane protein assembly factor BamB